MMEVGRNRVEVYKRRASSMVCNRARQRLVNSDLSLGVGVRLARTVDIARAMAGCGYDFLMMDLEHGTLSIDVAAQISVAALDADIAPFVRVQPAQLGAATRVLDGGGLGVVVSHVDTAAQAKEVVNKLRFPPLGHRSIPGAFVHNGFGACPADKMTSFVDAETLIVVMIETPEAVHNADAIAAIVGLDCLLIGTNDLAMEMGIPGQMDHADIFSAYRRVIAACRRHTKWPGMGGIQREDLLRQYIGMGMRMVISSSDQLHMIAGARQCVRLLRSCSSEMDG